MPLKSARNTSHKRQYRESGFVLVREADFDGRANAASRVKDGFGEVAPQRQLSP
jgi:hypothetical protein